MSNIDINQLIKRYGSTPVIHGIDAQIEEGEFAVLVGPSGCGKSTLLRMIAGLEEISEGTISIGGTVVNHLAPKDRDIAMVFQNYALYPHMSVAKNMGYSLKISGHKKDEIEKAVGVAARTLGLEDLLDRLPADLSGGQRQRVAMGRAIVRDPAVFLFDEPLSNLDAKLRVKMRAEIKKLHQLLKTTIVYVTHDQIEAMTMADKIIVLEAGVVSQVGTPLELYDNPANLFVGTFIGSPSMNVLPGKVVSHESIQLDDGQLVRLSNPLQTGSRIKIGIRPEHLSLSRHEQEVGTLRATVTLVEPTGAETLITCDCGGVEVLASVKRRVEYEPGAPVHFSIAPNSHHLFDYESELAITPLRH